MKKYYKFMSRVDNTCKLASFLNNVLEELDIVRIVSGPKTFDYVKTHENIQKEVWMFYESCLWERWLTEIVPKLTDWVNCIDTYFNEYLGSWKFFAAADRINCIREFGGEPEDYDADGNIIAEGISDEELAHYSVLSRLVQDDWMDIVQDTSPDDLDGMYSVLVRKEKKSVNEVLKEATGRDIPVYIQNEKGEMVIPGFAEKQMMKASRQYVAASRSVVLYAIARTIRNMVVKMKSLSPTEDNRKELEAVRSMSKDVLDLKLDSFMGEKDKAHLEKLLRA